MVDIESLADDIREMKEAMKEICKNTAANTTNIAALLAINSLSPMLIRWVIFPLVSLLATGFSIERIISA